MQKLTERNIVSNSINRISPKRPKIWAIGGGKGGVGKSIVSILLSLALARRNSHTVLIDADLGGANLHTLMGIKTPVRTLNDFITRKFASIHDIYIQTPAENLKLVCGASEILSLANPQFAQKNKITNNIISLPADHVVLDLGAGTSYNVLDFFLIADNPIVVLTPQPISIQNAYAFIRNTVYRKISRLASQQASLQEQIKTAMDPKNDNKMRTIQDLYDAVGKSHGEKTATGLHQAVTSVRPLLITNMAKDQRDTNAGRIIQLVAQKYLGIQSEELGAIEYDRHINKMVSQMIPLSELGPKSIASSNATILVERLLDGQEIN
jgi:flagellar biosynthesis protein FlhG